MDELIKTVVEKAGISESQAKTAIDVVVGQLKDKLPEPIAGQLESMLGWEGGGDDDTVQVNGADSALAFPDPSGMDRATIRKGRDCRFMQTQCWHQSSRAAPPRDPPHQR